MDNLASGMATCVAELKDLEAKNNVERAFAAKFWQANSDFSLARDVLLAAAGSINAQVTKFSLVMAKSKTPTEREAQSICEAIYDPCQQLLAALKVAIFAGAGYALTKEMIAGSLRIVSTMQELVRLVQVKEFARVPEFTGRIWDACNYLPTISKSNLIATKRVMLQSVAILNDTISELDGVLADQANGPTERNVEDEDEYAFDMDETMSPLETRQFTLVLGLLKMVQAITKKGVLAVNATETNDGQDGFLDWSGALPSLYDAVNDVIVDMGADVSPPFEQDVVLEHVAHVERVSLACLAHLRQRPGANDMTDLVKGEAAFNAKLAEVRDCLRLEDDE
ncbi:hypothetical protein SPRG_00930 [Saprolegnia parasitica CBS 223.65]|uniref:Cyclin-D1-binding protein 1-like N-terminal domain-containing protein n=1 Tax=Saprolegnia parasitica (strain CBS 223.65) TaxID=695850 RepID=A0A067D031_SAPPC|nr:hypothetical protein SPRG_00930 [Saprolegnia parasitica CBS 223.65]KDO34870.1 hypothetical protein SPRG_00930 [Saprolegnia parasitica CBS 223.65]|eukprot:XP_012194532.1 hypothetical protein SPRG_00930 [Saprolegnia parasitica CBS 223.65]